jgi:hypothetical protein
MQQDGNFVVYNPAGNWIWQSYTYGANGAHLVLQNDGHLWIYSASGAPFKQIY